MRRTSYLFSIFLFYTIMFMTCLAKPTEVLSSPVLLNPVQLDKSVSTEVGNNRQQRSPQFGLVNDYGDYSDYDDDDDESRNFKLGHKFKPHKLHQKPFGHQSGYGCHGYGCGGGYPEHGGHHQSGNGGSFATASAGSINAGGKPFGGHSEANAQSASFSFGPYTATFSVAQASSGRQRF